MNTHQIFEIPTLAPGEMNVNNILWGDSFFGGVSFSGAFPGVFVAADETGPPGDTPCFTGINGAVPKDLCTNGIPNLNAPGIGVESFPFYARFTTAHLMGDFPEPLPTGWAFRYLFDSTREEGPSTDLRIRDGLGGPVVCEYLSIPSDFASQCSMTQVQIDRLINGDIFVELETGGVSEEVRVYSAGSFIFVDGFESSDNSVWSSSTP